METDDANAMLGIGLYTATEAAKLTGVPAARIRRWLGGYDFRHGNDNRHSEALWTPQIPRLGREVELGFRDLIELRLVDAFEKAGLSLPAIRKALSIATSLIGDSHPFSTARFRTDGRTLFLQAVDAVGEPILLDILRKQYAFDRVIAPSFRDLDLEEGIAARWWPMSHDRAVVIDPTRSFGQPIVAKYGVPTRALADAIEAEGSIRATARIHDLPMSAIRDAVAFERRHAA